MFRRDKMSFINRLKNFFNKSADEEVEAEMKQLSEEELIAIIEDFELTEEEMTSLRDVFHKNLVDYLDEADEDALKEETMKLVISPAFLKEVNESDEAAKENEGKEINLHLQPKIVNAQNKILKEISFDAIEIGNKNRATILQLSDKLRTQRLYLLEKQWPQISEMADEINQSYALHRYAKVNQAIKKIKESYKLKDGEKKRKIQELSERELNSSVEALFKKIEDHLDYFRSWESREYVNHDYSVKSISQNFNQLMRDYLFYTAAKGGLVHLKNKQGMNRHALFQLSEELDRVDREFKDLKMDSWLAPANRANTWQHKLFKRLETTNKEIEIDCQIKLLLEEKENKED